MPYVPTSYVSCITSFPFCSRPEQHIKQLLPPHSHIFAPHALAPHFNPKNGALEDRSMRRGRCRSYRTQHWRVVLGGTHVEAVMEG